MIFCLLTALGSMLFHFNPSSGLALSTSTTETKYIARSHPENFQDHLDCATFQQKITSDQKSAENGIWQSSLRDDGDWGDNGPNNWTKNQTRIDVNTVTPVGAGTVIVFLHIAKTGGTTIRSFFGQQPHSLVRTRLSLKPGDFERNSLAIQGFLRNSNNPRRSVVHTSNAATATQPPIRTTITSSPVM